MERLFYGRTAYSPIYFEQGVFFKKIKYSCCRQNYIGGVMSIR